MVEPEIGEAATRRFRIEAVRLTPHETVIRLFGALHFAESTALWSGLRRSVARARRGTKLDFDMAEVTQLDSSAAALLAHVRAELHRRGVRCELVNAAEPIRQVIHLHQGDALVRRRRRRRPQGALEQIGRAVADAASETMLLLSFIGELCIANLKTLVRPRKGNWSDLWSLMERAGADALPIVALISFLVGLVSAAQSAAQLERYGANLFVADLVGISMTRELGPLMTAIVVTGRSGAAYAAQLGSMKVNDEIDALRTMGLLPMHFLVIPRALALLLMVPLLVVFSDVLGTLGGLVIGVLRLDLSVMAYLDRLTVAIKLWDIGSGLAKSATFALAIAVISCQQGLAARGGAVAVGQRTTRAVVSSLFALIVIDALFAVAVGMVGR